MFKTLSRLLFGGEEETPEPVKPGELVEEGWLVVSHQEAGTAGNQDSQADGQQSETVPHGDTVANIETGTSGADLESTVQTSSAGSHTISGSFSKPRALSELMESACVNKPKARADPHHMSRNALQRQNRVRHGVQHHAFHLQQPGHRNLSH